MPTSPSQSTREQSLSWNEIRSPYEGVNMWAAHDGVSTYLVMSDPLTPRLKNEGPFAVGLRRFSIESHLGFYPSLHAAKHAAERDRERYRQ